MDHVVSDLGKVGRRQKGFELYVAGVPLRQIALDLQVPYGTLHGWHSGEKWASKARQIRTDLQTEYAENLRILTGNAALALVRGKLAILGGIQAEIMRALQENPSVNELARLAQLFRQTYQDLEPHMKAARAGIGNGVGTIETCDVERTG